MANKTMHHLVIEDDNYEILDAKNRANIAAEYSASSTYNVGDVVLYSGQLYKCTTAIATAEAWTAAHWTAVTVGEKIADLEAETNTLKEDLDSLTLGIDDVDGLLYIYIGDQKQGDGIDIGGEPVTYGRIVLSTDSITISEESSGSVTVALMEAPSATQVVYVAVSDSSKITASPATLTFTTENWNTPQAVTVTALSDADSDDETESVVFTSRKVSSQTLTVHVTDITPSVVTNGLQLEFDFRNLESEATTVVDTISGVTLQNLDTQYFNKVTNGIYGSSNYKYASLLTSDSAYSAFKTAMANSATSGFTFEVFGTRMPNCGNTGNAQFLGTKSANGYDSTPSATSAPGINPAKMAYIDTNDAEQTATWTSNSEFDNGTVNGYITTEQQDFLQADIVFNADGTVDAYYNGYKNRLSFSTPENFASWDIDKALTPTNTYFLGAKQLGADSDHYLTFIRMYNRPLTQSEVTQNINYNKSVIGISNFQ